MVEDRFFSAFKSCVTRVLEDAAAVDYTATYTARVAAYTADAGTPSGVVDVQFTDGIAAQKLVSINAVPLLPPWPGVSYVPTVGSTVIVGWLGGDERSPWAAGWLGQGGCSEVDMSVSTVLNLGATVGTLAIVVQPIVTALTTVLTAVGTFATAVGVAVPGVAAAAVTLNTAIATFASGSSSYVTIKTKAA